MIGLGNWACNVNTMFFSGEAKIKIFDNNGSYGFELDVPGVTVPDIDVNINPTDCQKTKDFFISFLPLLIEKVYANGRKI